jgi:hypothetical protein
MDCWFRALLGLMGWDAGWDVDSAISARGDAAADASLSSEILIASLATEPSTVSLSFPVSLHSETRYTSIESLSSVTATVTDGVATSTEAGAAAGAEAGSGARYTSMESLSSTADTDDVMISGAVG